MKGTLMTFDDGAVARAGSLGTTGGLVFGRPGT